MRGLPPPSAFLQCLSFGLWFGIVWCRRSISCFRFLTSLPYMSIKSRVESGDHDVPEEKIIQRYDRALELIKDLVEYAWCFRGEE